MSGRYQRDWRRCTPSARKKPKWAPQKGPKGVTRSSKGFAFDPAVDRAQHNRRSRGRAGDRAERSRDRAPWHRASRAPASAAGLGLSSNKVAQTLAKTFFALGYVAVRFNFRGVGRSEGTFDDGEGEAADALAALRFAQARFDAKESALPIVLAGFSFGAFVQTKVAQSVAAQRLVLVGPAVRRCTTTTVPGDTIVIHGEEDDVVPLPEVLAWARPQELPIVVFPVGDLSPPRPAAASAALDRRDVAWQLAGGPGCLTPLPPTVRPAGGRGTIAGTADQVVLRVAGLRKSYGSKEVVRGLSFEIRRGECFGLLGPNGAGKTTTLRCCLGLIDPDGGTIEMAGARIPEAARQARARVGGVPRTGQSRPRFHRHRKPAGLRPLLRDRPSPRSRRAFPRCSNSPASRSEARPGCVRCRAA